VWLFQVDGYDTAVIEKTQGKPRSIIYLIV